VYDINKVCMDRRLHHQELGSSVRLAAAAAAAAVAAARGGWCCWAMREMAKCMYGAGPYRRTGMGWLSRKKQ